MGDLVKRLRYKPCDIALSIEERMVMRLLNGLMDEAADRIEQQAAEVEELKFTISEYKDDEGHLRTEILVLEKSNNDLQEQLAKVTKERDELKALIRRDADAEVNRICSEHHAKYGISPV